MKTFWSWNISRWHPINWVYSYPTPKNHLKNNKHSSSRPRSKSGAQFNLIFFCVKLFSTTFKKCVSSYRNQVSSAWFSVSTYLSGNIRRPLSMPGVYDRTAANTVSNTKPKLRAQFRMPWWKSELRRVLQMIKSAHCTTTIDTKNAVWQVYSSVLRSR